MIVKIITTIAIIITTDMTTVMNVSIRTLTQTVTIRIVTIIVGIIIDTITMAKIQIIIMVAHNDRMITSTIKGKITSLRKKIVTQWVRKTVRNTKADERPSTGTNIDDPTEMDEIMVMVDVDQDGQWMVTWTVAKEKASSEVMIIEIIEEQ